MRDIEITNEEYRTIQNLLLKSVGISLGSNKRPMVKARLLKRLHHYKVTSYMDYLKIVQLSQAEHTEFINQMSTNETYFFREKNHFLFLENLCMQESSIRIWSAAASIGAEAYSAAMVAKECLKNKTWEIIGSDVNTDALNIARKGLYPFSWVEKIPPKYRSNNCLKGKDSFEGKFLVSPDVAKRVNFVEHNLMYKNRDFGDFDVIFLRNVLLYFDDETKIKTVKNVISNLKRNGYLIIGMTETFNEAHMDELKFLGDSIYQKVE